MSDFESFIAGEGIQVVVIKPNDLVVMSYPGLMSEESYKRIVTAVGNDLRGMKVVVLEEGLRINAILRHEE